MHAGGAEMSLSIEPEIDREVTGASFKKPLNLARRRLILR
jgi:hypothetical protein